MRLIRRSARADGYINIGAANQSNWLRLVRLIDAEHLADDPRFVTNTERMANRVELESVLNGIFSSRTSAGMVGDTGRRRVSGWAGPFDQRDAGRSAGSRPEHGAGDGS